MTKKNTLLFLGIFFFLFLVFICIYVFGAGPKNIIPPSKIADLEKENIKLQKSIVEMKKKFTEKMKRIEKFKSCKFRNFDHFEIWKDAFVPSTNKWLDTTVFSMKGDSIAKEFAKHPGGWDFTPEFLNLVSGLKFHSKIDENLAVLDVGSNIGTFGIPVAKYLNITTILIEAHPQNQRAIKQALVYNNIEERATLIPFAVSNKPGYCFIEGRTYDKSKKKSKDAKFVYTGNAKLVCKEGNVEKGKIIDEYGKRVLVEVTTFDDIVPQIVSCGLLNDICDIRIIKMDIEGFEPYFVKGAEEFFRKCEPILITEMNEGNNVGMGRIGWDRKKFTNLMRSFGYSETFVIEGKPPNIIYTSFKNDLLHVHEYFKKGEGDNWDIFKN